VKHIFYNKIFKKIYIRMAGTVSLAQETVTALTINDEYPRYSKSK
jgi:hypothetical protein